MSSGLLDTVHWVVVCGTNTHTPPISCLHHARRVYAHEWYSSYTMNSIRHALSANIDRPIDRPNRKCYGNRLKVKCIESEDAFWAGFGVRCSLHFFRLRQLLLGILAACSLHTFASYLFFGFISFDMICVRECSKTATHSHMLTHHTLAQLPHIHTIHSTQHTNLSDRRRER